MVPSNVRLALSSSAPLVPAITILLSVKSETVALASVLSPVTPNVPPTVTLLLNAPVVAPLSAPELSVAVPSVSEPPVIAPSDVIAPFAWITPAALIVTPVEPYPPPIAASFRVAVPVPVIVVPVIAPKVAAPAVPLNTSELLVAPVRKTNAFASLSQPKKPVCSLPSY